MEECSERLERLLQRVHKANEENAALKALKLPTTPKTPTLARSSTTSSSNDWADGSRRRAATVDSHMSSTERSQNASVRIQRRLEEIRARRLARKEEEQKASSTDSKVASPAHMPTTEIRIKVEKLRARRQAREEEERMATNARNAFSPQSSSPSAVSVLQARTGYLESGGVYRNCSGSETAVECAADTDEDVYFFDNKDVIAMFREIPLPFKELDWEKQVHNFHVARTNDAYRKDTDDIKLRNCRAECIVDILGEKAASHVTAQESECGKEQQVQRRQSRLGDENVSNAVYNSDLLLIDSDFEDDNESERSSEWSRNGFGYIELRRMSRMSLEVPCEQSPVCRESGAKELGHGTSASVSPLSPIVPNSAKPQSPGTAHVTAAKFSKSITPSVMCRSSTNTNSITRANGGDTNSKGMLAKMRKSVDRVVPPPNRCDTLVNSMSTLSDSGALQQAASHPVPPAKVSSANEQILGHIANSSLLSIEQQMTQLTAENRMLKRQMLQARKAVDALARVVIRMQ
ncbi:hypothetical protein GGI23_003381 [Coemansia sp. RSA 2559]|nr:hypothetical protein GGI23_003381 [Coemansia sp. RSA 2559]